MHIPVLQKEVLEYLDPKPNENFIDCTINGGGHALAILERVLPNGKVLGIDWSPEQISDLRRRASIYGSEGEEEDEVLFAPQISETKLKDHLILACDNFNNLKEIVEKQKFKKISGILFDLGMSSWHLESSGRGFSFARAKRRARDEQSSANLKKEPLDMRYNPQNPITAEKILNYYSGKEIEEILREYGEERFSKKISEEVIKTRKVKPIKDTLQLTEIIRRAVSDRYLNQRINPATRTFQALRIAVNNELNNLEESLPQALEVLEKDGRIAIISFQSLEDRIVKNFFKNQAQEGKIKILTKKPVVPAGNEVKINPRSRSAKLRAAIKVT